MPLLLKPGKLQQLNIELFEGHTFFQSGQPHSGAIISGAHYKFGKSQGTKGLIPPWKAEVFGHYPIVSISGITVQGYLQANDLRFSFKAPLPKFVGQHQGMRTSFVEGFRPMIAYYGIDPQYLEEVTGRKGGGQLFRWLSITTEVVTPPIAIGRNVFYQLQLLLHVEELRVGQ